MGNFDSFSRMPKNNEFRNQNKALYDKERNLVTAMNAEMVNHHGIPCHYYEVTYDRSYDPLFGEDCDRRILSKTRINLIGELPKKEEQWMSFGIEGLDTLPLFLVKRHFRAVFKNDTKMPQVGDFLQLVYDSRMFEITAVYDDPTTALHKTAHIWEVRLKVWVDDNSVDIGDNIPDIIRHNEGDIFEVGDIDKTNYGNGDEPIGWSESQGKGFPTQVYEPKPTDKMPNDVFGGF